MKERSKQQIREETPDEGTILGYALATHHRGNNKPDQFMRRPARRSACCFPEPEQSSPREDSTRSPSSATSRAA